LACKLLWMAIHCDTVCWYAIIIYYNLLYAVGVCCCQCRLVCLGLVEGILDGNDGESEAACWMVVNCRIPRSFQPQCLFEMKHCM
jgi:hypothetical protein